MYFNYINFINSIFFYWTFSRSFKFGMISLVVIVIGFFCFNYYIVFCCLVVITILIKFIEIIRWFFFYYLIGNIFVNIILEIIILCNEYVLLILVEGMLILWLVYLFLD